MSRSWHAHAGPSNYLGRQPKVQRKIPQVSWPTIFANGFQRKPGGAHWPLDTAQVLHVCSFSLSWTSWMWLPWSEFLLLNLRITLTKPWSYVISHPSWMIQYSMQCRFIVRYSIRYCLLGRGIGCDIACNIISNMQYCMWYRTFYTFIAPVKMCIFDDCIRYHIRIRVLYRIQYRLLDTISHTISFIWYDIGL